MKKDNLYEQILSDLYHDNTLECYNYLNENPRLASKLWDDTLEYLYAHIKPSEINTIDDLAKLLNNNTYGNELDNPYGIKVEELCKQNKWIVLFPYSDDVVEVRGYIDDELGGWNGAKLLLYKKGEFYLEDEHEETYKKAKHDMIVSADDDQVYQNEIKEGRVGINVQWGPQDKDYVWYISTEFKNATYFDIIDDEDDDEQKHAHCCIIDCSNIF